MAKNADGSVTLATTGKTFKPNGTSGGAPVNRSPLKVAARGGGAKVTKQPGRKAVGRRG
jgi:hypothetical protein